MKVAMVDPSLFTGLYDDALCAALAARGHEVALLGRPMRDTDAIVPDGYRYVSRYFTLSERLRRMTGDGVLARAAKGGEYLAGAMAGSLHDLARADVVHVQWLPFAGADARWIARLARRAGRPALVHTVHNAQAFHGDAGVQGRGYHALLGRFDRLIVHGEPTRAALMAQGVAPHRIIIASHPPMRLAGADAEMLATVPDPLMPRLLFFGTIRPYKGFDLLIDACIGLWREGVRFELAVAGKPFMDIAPLIAQVEAAGYADRLILALDFLKEGQLDAHIQKADMIAFPYRHIDSSGAFLSALPHGKAMVCARVGMFADLPDDAASLCAPDDAAALAGALRPLIADEAARARLGAGARALYDGMAGWDHAAERTEAVYADAITEVRA